MGAPAGGAAGGEGGRERRAIEADRVEEHGSVELDVGAEGAVGVLGAQGPFGGALDAAGEVEPPGADAGLFQALRGEL